MTAIAWAIIFSILVWVDWKWTFWKSEPAHEMSRTLGALQMIVLAILILLTIRDLLR